MKVLTVGGAMIDTIAIIDSCSIERMSLLNKGASFLLLEEGRKTEAIEVSTHSGGGAINAAVAFARLGCQTATLIRIGRDVRADQILARLAEEGIAATWVLQGDGAPTGSSVHVSSHDRNAAVFTFRGANTLLAPEDLPEEAFDADLVYVANLSNEAARCFPTIVAKAKAHGAKVAANPGIRQIHGRGREFLTTLPAIDILSLNRREACEALALLSEEETEGAGALLPLVAGPRAPPSPLSRELRHEGRRAPLAGFLGALIRRGVGCVVFTDGADGAVAARRDGLFYCPARPATVAGTAGAGDAFASTFSAYAARGYGLVAALQAASANAASVLGFVDTQTGLRTRRDLDRDLEDDTGSPAVMEFSHS